MKLIKKFSETRKTQLRAFYTLTRWSVLWSIAITINTFALAGLAAYLSFSIDAVPLPIDESLVVNIFTVVLGVSVIIQGVVLVILPDRSIVTRFMRIWWAA